MDEVFRSEFKEEDGKLYRVLTQPTEDLILARNAELRKNRGAMRDLGAASEGGSFGRQVASIPLNMYEKAIRDGYDLNSPDADRANREMLRYLQSAEGRQCLIR